MKKNAIIATLAVFLGVVGYGVYGRSQADQATYSCTTGVGPLCFAWKKNSLGGLEDAAKDLADSLKKATE